jgi:pimeloyl-ACP methyl ester carboxylesterase
MLINTRSLAVVVLALLGCRGSSPAPKPTAARSATSARGLHYEDAGRGDPIVLIHGFQMDLREWDEIAPVLAQARRVIRYDARGHGRSAAIDAPFFAHEDLDALLTELGVSRADVVGLSMGSNIALEFALMHPGRVRRLVMISPGLPDIRVTASRAWMTPIMTAVRAGNGAEAARLWWESPMLEGTRARGAAGERYRAVVLANGRIWTQNPSAQRQLEPSLSARLSRLTVPLVVIVGGADATGAVPQSDSIAARLPSVQRLTIPNAGHMVSTERPGEIVAALNRFLRR